MNYNQAFYRWQMRFAINMSYRFNLKQKKELNMTVNKRPNSKTKKKNPLYVVTNNGKDIEMADGFFDALIKKFHLEPVVDFFKMMLEILMDNVTNYAWFKVMSEKVNEWLDIFVKLLARVNVLA